MTRPFCLLAIICASIFLSACQPVEIKPGYADAIASAHPLATEAGIEILQQGGNAFDAAITVTSVLAVVEPYSSGIGGGGFYLLHRDADQKRIMLDGRERAPLAATRDMYLDEKGNVIPKASIDGALAAGIPGIPASLVHLAEHYGNLPLTQTLAAAIRHAREGFPVDDIYRKMAGFRLKAMQQDDDARAIFLRAGDVPELGTIITQPDLANTLEAIATNGMQGFYHGEIAQRMVEDVRANGGIWSREDLAEYRVVEREPITGTYQQWQITSAAPPSSGGVALVSMLNMLENLPDAKADAEMKTHQLTEVMRRAYRDRAEFLGDSDFVDVPVNKLINKSHAKNLLQNYQSDDATPSEALKAIPVPGDRSQDTTHFSILDKDGNRVSATLSINYPFGACMVAKGTGVLLNDEMDDFSMKPGVPNVYGLVGAEANAIEPGKRPLSSMSPSFVDGPDGFAIIGTPGGSRIITMVLHGILAYTRDASAQAIVSQPRMHHQYLPDTIQLEPGALSEDIRDALTLRGHRLSALTNTFGNMQVITVRGDDIQAASDPRGIGSAQVTR